jgi:hypothetical protein
MLYTRKPKYLWVMFESGALSKVVKKSMVVPYLFELESSDVKQPIAQFHRVKADKEGNKKTNSKHLHCKGTS